MEVETLNKSIEFVLMREKKEGGFGATPLLPATIEDTYYAVKILYLCNYSPNIELLKYFLFRQHILKLSIKPLTKYFKLLNYLNLLNTLPSYVVTKCKNNLKAFILEDLTNIELLCCISEIFELLGVKDIILEIKKQALSQIFSFNLKTLKSFYFLYKIVKKDFPVKFLNDILDSQNPDGGFGFFKGTTSYMENTYYACYILYYLNFKPRNLIKLKEFILSCYNADGGFGRNSQGISFLESTYHALWIFKNFNLLK
ncbi:MAG: hypothetical protein C0190_00865 [Thermodesulfobacterium geofontis]|uniref:Prenyltransferase alpha-alpha toroid domain-containing protein n=1 Tax=Thermodesulfobacterium geofontis TaxID=1295609 RepID=A0A2N7PQ51_9BACT|nr:MAG: hypothetical protein C0190_00865 [Thermodesulfobacterium geofontis]